MIVETVITALTLALVGGAVERRRRANRQRGIAALGTALRALHEAPALIAVPGEHDAAALYPLAGIERGAEVAELRRLGFVRIGEAVSSIELPGPRNVILLMASADHLIVARVVASHAHFAESVTLVSASAAGDEVMTVRQRVARAFPTPPHIDWLARVEPVALQELLELHRARMDNLPDRQPFRSAQEVVDAHVRARARTVAWRATQGREALLEGDLRGLLGPRFDKLGPTVLAALRAPVPRAVVLPKR